jgi:hypothetical protein
MSATDESSCCAWFASAGLHAPEDLERGSVDAELGLKVAATSISVRTPKS